MYFCLNNLNIFFSQHNPLWLLLYVTLNLWPSTFSQAWIHTTLREVASQYIYYGSYGYIFRKISPYKIPHFSLNVDCYQHSNKDRLLMRLTAVTGWDCMSCVYQCWWFILLLAVMAAICLLYTAAIFYLFIYNLPFIIIPTLYSALNKQCVWRVLPKI
jgi:hypothetical protein